MGETLSQLSTINLNIDMWSFISTHEQTLRLSFFIGTLSLMMLWEVLAPCRTLSLSKKLRWTNNLGLVFLNSLLLRLLLPAGAVGVAAWASTHQLGLLNGSLFFNLITVKIILAIVLLDLVIYSQHRLFHRIPILWKLHQVHHADLDIDVTTGIRFHPIEIIISMLIKFLAIILLGAPVIAVILLEIILNSMALFNHSNIKLPKKTDRYLRKLIVTPDMHRVHHSTEHTELNRNFGFNLSIWDYWFNSYQDQPKLGHHNMQIGLKEPRKTQITNKILGMLKLPFK